jgi:hypothetical protein
MKKIISIVVLSLILIQCNSDKDFIITKNSLGEINKKTTVAELDKIFENDSVVKLPENLEVFSKYRVFDKTGKHLLTISLDRTRDSIKGIGSVKIFSNQYKTEKGLTTDSTFKDVINNYSISKVEPFISSVIVSLDEINAGIALDKKDLNIGEFDMRKISKDQIPDMAKIKYITLWFD